jgi:hypothetical protein
VISATGQRFTNFDPPPVDDLVLPQPPLDDVFDVSLPPPPVIIDPEAIDPKDIPEANELDAMTKSLKRRQKGVRLLDIRLLLGPETHTQMHSLNIQN